MDVYVQGRRLRRSLKTIHKDKAHDRYRQWRDLVYRQPEHGDILFNDLCEQYMKYAWNEKPASALREEQRLEKIKAFLEKQGVDYLSGITSMHIDQFKAALKDGTLYKGDRRRSKATVNRYLQILRGMFNKAIAWGVYDKANPLKRVRFYKERSPIKPLDADEVAKVLKASREISDSHQSPLQAAWFDLVTLALNTGMRKSEILNLKWTDIKGGEFVSVVGKGEKRRDIPLNNKAREIIERQVRRGVFVFNIPNRYQHDLLRRTVAQVRKRTGVERFRFHLLRHYFSTSLLQRGVDIVTISDILGHSKMSTSLIYSHTNFDRKRVAVERIENV